MRIISLLCLVICPLVVSAQQPMPGDPPKEDPQAYFPLSVGSWWTYKYPGGTFTMKVTKEEKIGDFLNAARIETLDKDGKMKFFEHVAYKEGEGFVRVSVKGQKAEPPLTFLKIPIPDKGQTWDFKTKISMKEIEGKFTSGGEEEVTVPKGKYKAWKVSSGTTDVSGQNVVLTYYYAKDVGMVKQVVLIGGRQTEIELSDFKIEGKKKK